MGELTWANLKTLMSPTKIDAMRYQWLREHPAWETEAFLSGLTPEEFDAAVDKAIQESE